MRKSRLIVLIVAAGLFVWLFADALFHSQTFVFRDAGHYYYPLFQLIRDEWWAGRVPLWNPYENLGTPLAANATGSVFYPGTLIFLLPLDYAWAYKLYVMGHVLFALGTAYWVARRWDAGPFAAGAAAISYAFSGSVLFQYCNVVFLVGAAWLPLAVLAAERMLVGRSVRWALALGLVLAMITLGGDPQTAYQAGLLGAMYALWLWWRGSPASDLQGVSLGGRLARSRPLLLAVAALAGLVLAAVQVLPSMEFSARSGRRASPVARSIWELPQHLRQPRPAPDDPNAHWWEGLTCRRIEPGTHHEHVYHFSVGPWRLAEYLWPNVGGRQFPTHRRWLEVIPGEGRLWVPSLYMGLIPLILALTAFRLRGGEVRRNWLSWTAVLCVTASLGWHGLGWLIHEIRVAAGGDPSSYWLVGPPLGGPYWLMTVLLPGFVYFRYPAKLLIPAAFALSMLAAAGWDRTFGKKRCQEPFSSPPAGEGGSSGEGSRKKGDRHLFRRRPLRRRLPGT